MTVEAKTSLTPEQLQQYHEKGYITGIRIFDADGCRMLEENYEKLLALLPPGKDMNFVNWWHKRNSFIYGLCTHPRILDYLECILGPNFILWGSHFFTKAPEDTRVVPWHQDAKYWPLTPRKAATVFLAFTDCDRGNACMRVIPGTHRDDELRHHDTASKDNYVLNQEIPLDELDESNADYIEMKVGEISLHDDALIHGSGPNPSPRRRVGLTARYSSTDVKCDLSIWPNFRAYLVRGVDENHLNPAGIIPKEFAAPEQMFPE